MMYPDVNTINPNRLISYYLMSSYLYYHEDKSVLSDNDFDIMCKRILEKWKEIKHPHKPLVKKKSLEAGTGYKIRRYTDLIIHSAMYWYDEYEKQLKYEKEHPLGV